MPKKKSGESVHHQREHGLEDRLMENLIELQKIHTNLAEKFDKLSKEISQLLALFELAARSFSKHPAIKATETDKAFLEKIDKLLEQNKTIARGLTLMEDQMKKKMYETPEAQQTEPYMPSLKTNRPLPRF